MPLPWPIVPLTPAPQIPLQRQPAIRGFSLWLLGDDNALLSDQFASFAIMLDMQAPAWPRHLGAHVPNKELVHMPAREADQEDASRAEQLSRFGTRMEHALSSVCDAVINAAPDLDALDARCVKAFCESHYKLQDGELHK